METKDLENQPKKKGQIEKNKAHVIVELIEYEHDEIVSKTIMQKLTGSVNAIAVAEGKGLDQKISPFDTYIQIIDGSAKIDIDGVEAHLNLGEGILVPAHKASKIIPNGRFKLLVTVIKSGYEN